MLLDELLLLDVALLLVEELLRELLFLIEELLDELLLLVFGE
jgi:hypothetical protein